MKLITIGVYGFTREAFFGALQAAGVQTFCDIRWRRGVRGADYAFANSARLQQRLQELEIRYLHLRELAPPPTLRQRQKEADKASKTAKRKRSALGELFVAGYHEQCLETFDSRRFLEQMGAADSIALFCVEREPCACHRSLLAERLARDLGSKIDVVHLMPELVQL
jgi:uncharacterized protein (DUF488 family)